MPDNQPVLVSQSLKKQYLLGEHQVDALRGVDITINKGEFVAIMGPSGSGKSTLLHLLGGLDQPSQGEVILANHPLKELDDKHITLVRRHNVGFIFQFFNLMPTLTAEENILLPIIIDGKQVSAYQTRTDELLNLVGLADRRTHKPDQLSGGEQQRVAIARALLTEPAIVLADEPTGNLDSLSGTAIMELLRRSCDTLSQTIIVVTHDPRAAAFADRVIFLLDGEIIAELHFEKDAELAHNVGRIMEQMENLETLRQ
jgi:putative ABC transport system ATP-binding protein